MHIGPLGGVEIIIILVVVLLIFGPKNLPKLGKAVGRTVKNLRDGMDSSKNDDEAEAVEAEEKKVEEPVVESVEEKDEGKSSEKAE